MKENSKETRGRPCSDDPLIRIPLRGRKKQRETWREAANVAAGGNLSMWIRDVLDAAARKVLNK